NMGLLYLRTRLLRRQLVQERPAGVPAKEITYLLDGAAKHRLLCQQFAAHGPPLLTHPRTDEHRPRRLSRFAPGRAVCASLAREKRIELLLQLRLVMSYERQAKFVMRPLHTCRKADVAERCMIQATFLPKRVQIGPRQIGQRRRTASRERQNPCAAVVVFSVR